MKLQGRLDILVSKKRYFSVLELTEHSVLRLLPKKVGTNSLNIVVDSRLVFIRWIVFFNLRRSWKLITLLTNCLCLKIFTLQVFLPSGLYVRVAVPVLIEVVVLYTHTELVFWTTINNVLLFCVWALKIITQRARRRVRPGKSKLLSKRVVCKLHYISHYFHLVRSSE